MIEAVDDDGGVLTIDENVNFEPVVKKMRTLLETRLEV